MSKIINLGSSGNKQKKIIMAIVLTAVLVVVLLFIFAVFVPLKNGKSLINGGSFIEDSSSSKDRGEDLQTKAQKLVDAGKAEEAVRLIQNDPKFGTDSYNHSLLADAYLNSNQPDKALEVLLDMEKKFGLTHHTAAARIAELYKSKGDREKATSYYRKAIEIARKSKTPTRQWDIEQLEQKLKGL